MLFAKYTVVTKKIEASLKPAEVRDALMAFVRRAAEPPSDLAFKGQVLEARILPDGGAELAYTVDTVSSETPTQRV